LQSRYSVADFRACEAAKRKQDKDKADKEKFLLSILLKRKRINRKRIKEIGRK